MLDPAERDATVIKQAYLSGVINHYAATEVICSRTPSQIQLIKQNYHSKFGVLLEQDIAALTSGDHKEVCFPDYTFLNLVPMFPLRT